jgi:reductive dehalogenase
MTHLIVHTLYLLIGVSVSLLTLLFIISSSREKNTRAALINLTVLIIFGIAWFGSYFLFNPRDSVLFIGTLMIILLAALFIIPISPGRSIRIGNISEKVDERDAMFAREEYTPGTDKYEIYYRMRPELREIDDRIRELPELLEPGGRFYDPIRSRCVESVFRVIEELTTRVDGNINRDRTEVESQKTTAAIKSLAKQLGADEVGVALLNPMFVYSHIGRGPAKWGEPILNNHKFVIAFTLQMDYERVQSAPHLRITEETALQYLRGAVISIALAQYIRELGYPARAHIAGSNYEIMLPAVAHDAGLGELGRIGYLISPRFGARIRLGAITTDLPLIPDKPIVFGVQNFCQKCLKCAANCPSGAIPAGDKEDRRGVEKWPLSIERCFHYWRVIGTDCGICMKVCPFSHPDARVHNLIRKGIKNSSFARTISIHGDDLMYGKKTNLVKI